MEYNSLSYTPFCYRWLVDLFHFLEVDVGHLVVAAPRACACAGIGVAGCLLSLGLGVEYILLGCAEGCFDFLDCSVDCSDILSLVSLFEFGNCSLDSGALVGRNLVAKFAELLLCLEHNCVGLVEFVDAFFLACVGIGIGSSLVLHSFDFGVGKTAGGLDTYALLLAGRLVLDRKSVV